MARSLPSTDETFIVPKSPGIVRGFLLSKVIKDADVRCWSLADIGIGNAKVCFDAKQALSSIGRPIRIVSPRPRGSDEKEGHPDDRGSNAIGGDLPDCPYL